MSKRRSRLAVALLMVGLVIVAAVIAACNSSNSPATTAAPSGSNTTAATSGAGTTVASPNGGTIDAAALYESNCVSCHHRVPQGPASMVQSAVENGKGSMPGYRDELTVDEITALVQYVSAGGN